MLIATFGADTGWAGKTITREGDAFILEGHGPITAHDVMEYDRQGHLVWANDGTRSWVGSKAVTVPSAQSSTRPDQAVAARTAMPNNPTPGPKAVVTISLRTLVIAGIAVGLVIAAGATALMVTRSGASDGAASAQSSTSPKWGKVMSLSGVGGAYWGQQGPTSSAAFEVSGAEQRLDWTLTDGRTDIWVISTAGPDSGHSNPVASRTAGSGSVTLYKEPGRYMLEVLAAGGQWTVTLWDKR